MNIIEFAEFPLYPVQRVALKLAYNIPLDNAEIVFRSRFNGLQHTLTEQEYLRWCYEHGLSNQSEQRCFQETVIFLGRRAGSILLTSLIKRYNEAYPVVAIGEQAENHSYVAILDGHDTCMSTPNMLVLRLPTWHANPTIPVAFFENERKQDPVLFDVDFGVGVVGGQ